MTQHRGRPNGRHRIPALALVTVALTSLFVAITVASSRAADFDLAAYTTAALEVYNEQAANPVPFLTTEQTDKLVSGQAVRIRRRDPRDGDDAPKRVTGYKIYQRPRPHVWLAALDPNFQASGMLTEARLSHDSTGNSRWYQHLALPWPVTDRHWVIDLGKDLQACEQTEGLIWVHRWDLTADGLELARATVAAGQAGELTLKKIEKAIYLPVNKGAWIMIALDTDVTLVVYQVQAVLGGSVPDSWITTFAMAQLDGLLRKVDEHAEDAWRSYDPDQTPIFSGDGSIIPSLAGDDR